MRPRFRQRQEVKFGLKKMEFHFWEVETLTPSYWCKNGITGVYIFFLRLGLIILMYFMCRFCVLFGGRLVEGDTDTHTDVCIDNRD